MGEDEDDGDVEYVASFEGPCTCPEDCPNQDDASAHTWGECGGELPDGSDCPCEAGWVE